MRVLVSLFPGTFSVYPDPAEVSQGSPVEWSVILAGMRPFAELKVALYFDKGSPFKWQRLERDISTDADGTGSATVDAGAPQTPGDYKYGVEVQDGGDLVIDVDPRLIVR